MIARIIMTFIAVIIVIHIVSASTMAFIAFLLTFAVITIASLMDVNSLHYVFRLFFTIVSRRCLG